MKQPCPSCPDGNEWNSNGPTGRACPTCNGKAYIGNEPDDEIVEHQYDENEPDEFEEAIGNCCGWFEEGENGRFVCGAAGSEDCDFDCPYREEVERSMRAQAGWETRRKNQAVRKTGL